MPPTKFRMSEELRATIKAEGDFFDITKYFVDKCYEINGIEETHQAYEERLKDARKSADCSQKDLAEAIGCSAECISRIECKKNVDIDIERLRVIACMLNVTPYYLIGAADQWDHALFFHRGLNKICELQAPILFLDHKEINDARRLTAKDHLQQVKNMKK